MRSTVGEPSWRATGPADDPGFIPRDHGGSAETRREGPLGKTVALRSEHTVRVTGRFDRSSTRVDESRAVRRASSCNPAECSVGPLAGADRVAYAEVVREQWSGRRGGDLPYGQRLAEDICTIEDDPYEQEAVTRIVKLYEGGVPCKPIVR